MRAELKEWAKKNIVWKGNQHTNKSDRKGHKPEVIVNHISEGSISSLISWFTSPNNDQSSTHFAVAKDGKVYQFLLIENNAWGNGLALENIPKATSKVVKGKPNANPNWYSVSIEHEGIHEQTKGALTPEQLESTIMLHQYIREYVKDKWGNEILADRDHILGHYEIDPVRKPFCPGEKFPFSTIIERLQVEAAKPVEDWKDWGINLLGKEKIMSDPAYWKVHKNESIPVWAAAAMMGQIIERIKKIEEKLGI